MLKIEKECKFLSGPKNAEAELLISFNASIKFKKSLLPAATSKKVLPHGLSSVSAIVDDSPRVLAPWFSSVSISPSKGRLLVADHRMSVSSVGVLL